MSTLSRLITRGEKRGPVTRLINPDELGRRLKPFVFLDLAEIPPGPQTALRWHPHSGIATVTIILDGEAKYQETTGVTGTLLPGAVEWMSAGLGVWHTAAAVGTRPLRGFQLWLALPPDREGSKPVSAYVDPTHVARSQAARVILGTYGAGHSVIDPSSDATLIDVQLKPGERWSYRLPDHHAVCWLAVHAGQLMCPELLQVGDLVIFEEPLASVDIATSSGGSFILGSAVKHPYDLHIGNHSIHTSANALANGEQEIARLKQELTAAGILS